MGDEVELEDLAATYSPVRCRTVPWALGFFTAEFGMGSGAGTPPWPPGRPAQPPSCDGRGVIRMFGSDDVCGVVWQGLLLRMT